MGIWVVPLYEATNYGCETVGGKARNLGLLIRYGFTVAPGAVVLATAYRAFVNENNLHPLMAALASVDASSANELSVETSLEELRSAILAGTLPQGIEDDLHGILQAQHLLDESVAIRSSATAEDGDLASFAGIHSSYLNIKGLANMTTYIKTCYASLWTPKALAYRRRLTLSDEAVVAAVVVQKMVAAQTSGVAFSADPLTGRRDRMVVAASWGLGEAVVSGAVDPDQVTFDTGFAVPRIIHRYVGRKDMRIVAGTNHGTRVESLPDARTECLDDQVAIRLAFMVQRIDSALSGPLDRPQDVEWAWDGDRLWIMQARPITRLPSPTFPELREQPVIWSNANLKEVVPGVLSPLGSTVIRQALEHNSAAICHAGGLPVPDSVRWIRSFHGRLYFNLSAIQWSFYQIFGVSPADTNRAMGGHQPEIQRPPRVYSKARDRVVHTRRFLRATIHVSHHGRTAPAIFSEYWNTCRKLEHEDLTLLSDAGCTLLL